MTVLHLVKDDDTTEYYKCHLIRGRLANKAVASISYSLDVPTKCYIDEIRLKLDPTDIGRVRLDILNDKDFESLGFVKHDSLYLMPLWIFPFLQFGTKLDNLDGKSCTVKQDYMDPWSDDFIEYSIDDFVLSWGIKV